ncbi:hypothetical protein K9L05_03325 [Candidatus Babeliales bacterium]|nr:hypothetical protein [Candidatus Babeliales bacterium]MCF7899652.1 hypothetical protein [Candidatus Babeliales bacterium]
MSYFNFFKKILVLNFVFISNIFCENKPNFAITYSFEESKRLGDKILLYCKTKWLAHKYNLQLFFEPFPYSEQFNVSKLETFAQKEKLDLFRNKIKIDSEYQLINHLNSIKEDTLFIAHFWTNINGNDFLKNQTVVSMLDSLLYNCDCLYLSTIQDEKFGQIIKKALKPIAVPKKVDLPEDRITVAVHIRKGGGYDPEIVAEQYFDLPEYNIFKNCNINKIDNTLNQRSSVPEYSIDKAFPSLFPPEQFYVDQIMNMSDLLKDFPMFVYVFTDDKKPQELVERLKNKIKKNNIIFATRSTQNLHDKNVIEDLYIMSQFDCLIRGSSHFSWASQMLGKHKIIISVQHATWISDTRLIVDKINVFLRQPEINDPKKIIFDNLLNRI